MYRLALLILLAFPALAQESHPRIWLDSATMTRLEALRNANDPLWTAVKSKADTLLTYPVDAYDRNTCLANHICYAWQGFGWHDALSYLALAYKVTGDTTYSTKVKDILAVMIAAGAPPLMVDSGYPSRSALLGFALAYDWCYDQLNATDKTNLAALVNSYWDWVQASGYQWATGKNAYGNYFGGHLLGYGLAGIATEGDNARAGEIMTTVESAFTSIVVPAFQTGGFAGGYPPESFNYGQSHVMRLMKWMSAMKSAGKTDYITGTTYAKNAAVCLLYNERPDRWTVTDEGDFSGSYAKIFPAYYPLFLSFTLGDTTEGNYAQWQYRHKEPSGYDIVSDPTAFDKFLYYDSSRTGTNYNTLSTSYYSAGDNHTFTRTDWTDTAIHTTFAGGTAFLADHQARGAGHISIQRGADYLLVNSGQWKGTTGISGAPEIMDGASWRLNTLYYWDGGVKCLGEADARYVGCQGYWGTSSSALHKEGTDYTYNKADLRPAYYNNNSETSLSTYYRSFVNVGGITFVFDRIAVPDASYSRTLMWHLNAQATNTNDAGVVKSTFGTSNLYIKPLLPATASLVIVNDNTDWTGTTKFSERVEVANSATSTSDTFLTVLAPTASSVGTMPTTTLVDATTHKGALYDDGTPRVALFSVDGTSKSNLAYTTSYTGTGRHVIGDVTAGTYAVSVDGAETQSGLVVGCDGVLSFTSVSGEIAVYQGGADVTPAGSFSSRISGRR